MSSAELQKLRRAVADNAAKVAQDHGLVRFGVSVVIARLVVTHPDGAKEMVPGIEIDITELSEEQAAMLAAQQEGNN